MIILNKLLIPIINVYLYTHRYIKNKIKKYKNMYFKI